MTTFPTITNAVAATTSSNASSTTANATLSSDFETFLEMLTVQARYQDPLDPISSSDYAAQLAQFSMVEQQVFTNEKLGALTNALGGSTMGSFASWIGMEARVATSVEFRGQPIAIAPSVAANADRAQLVVYNDFGSEVLRTNIPTSADQYVWDGRDAAGQPLGDGMYRFAVESYAGEELVQSTPAEVYARVVEAHIQGPDTVLKLQGGASVRASEVTGLREPT